MTLAALSMRIRTSLWWWHVLAPSDAGILLFDRVSETSIDRLPRARGNGVIGALLLGYWAPGRHDHANTQVLNSIQRTNGRANLGRS